MKAETEIQAKRILVNEEEGFINVDGVCISWGQTGLTSGGSCSPSPYRH